MSALVAILGSATPPGRLRRAVAEALERKPVAIVAMGASPHHYLGAERHLRDVLSFFGADVLPVAGYLTSADFDAGEPTAGAAAELDALIGELRDRAARPAYDDQARLRPLIARRPPR